MCTFWRNYFRYLLVIVAFFCLLSVNSNHMVINFTFICMASDFSSSDFMTKIRNNTEGIDYTPAEKAAILWAIPIGILFGSIPVNYCYTKYGARWPFFAAGILSAIATAAIPQAAQYDLKALLALRFVQGFAFAANFGAIGIFCCQWAPLTEIAIFTSVLTCFTPVTSVVTNPFSAWMCNTSLGWPAAFYFHAAFGLVMFILWLVLYVDDPQEHRILTQTELTKIKKGKISTKRDDFVPYKEVLTNKVILIVWLNAFAFMIALQFLLAYAPTYFSTVLGFDVAATGTLSSLATAIHLPVKVAGGIISDNLTIIPERYKMWFFNTLSAGVAGVCTFLIGVFPSSQPMTGVVMFTVTITFMALNAGSVYKCGTLCARQYSHVVLTVIQFMKCVGMIVAPALYYVFIRDESSYDQWRYAYWLQGAALVIVNVMFYPIATDQPAAFTKITRATRELEKKSGKGSLEVRL